MRYMALRALEVDAVATGHTLDDQAETVMMKLLRGAWTEGLGGISPEVQGLGITTPASELAGDPGIRNQGLGKARIVRPLLEVRRAEVEEFLRSRGQAWREDATNRDVSLTRNRVRHELMPMLRSFNPEIDAVLARMAAIARDEEAFWQAELVRVLPQVLLPGAPVRGGGRAVSTAVGSAAWAVEITRLAAMPAALRRRVVRAAARSCGGRLSAKETAKVLALAGLGEETGHPVKVFGRSGCRLELAGGLRVQRSARELRFWREG
jgi:tRNA(Ile)-lysidine synthase